MLMQTVNKTCESFEISNTIINDLDSVFDVFSSIYFACIAYVYIKMMKRKVCDEYSMLSRSFCY